MQTDDFEEPTGMPENYEEWISAYLNQSHKTDDLLKPNPPVSLTEYVDQEERKKAQKPKAQDTGSENNAPGNIYKEARIKVLSGYPEWRQREIARMEREGTMEAITNRWYDEFVRDVIQMAEKDD